MEVNNWVLVPDFENANFSRFNLKTMMEPLLQIEIYKCVRQ